MTEDCVEITAPSRLHFGMFSFGSEGGRAFGGVGAMIDSPGVRVRITPDSALHADGPHKDRARKFAMKWAEETGHGDSARCRIEVLDAPPQHVGLGVGTQLAMAIAKGLDALLDGNRRTAAELSRLVGRGERSAVGVHGFSAGGLVVERGKSAAERLAPLVGAYPIPSAWRFVLIRPPLTVGAHGQAERNAFAALPPVPDHITRRLWSEVHERMIPALTAGEFDRFSESVYQFGRTAGECFAPVQGGPFNGPVLGELVTAIRAAGVAGVGQSSWGPTLYCLLPEPSLAEEFSSQMQREFASLAAEYVIAAPCNDGAKVHTAGR